MRQELNKSRYVLAAILTLIIFAAGFSIGLVIEKARLISSDRSIMEQKLGLSSLQAQQLFLDTYSISSCGSIQKLLKSNMDDLDRSMKSLVKYNKKSIIDRDDFELNLRNYFITELQYFLISEKIKTTCSLNTANILYMYTETEESDMQGYVLDFLKKKFGDQVLIFSFNANFEKEPLIGMLAENYALTQFPAVIINGKTFEGFTSEETLASEVCASINNMSPYCP
jgi:hypothetical protein